MIAGNYDGQTWIVIYKLLVVLWIIFGLSYLSMTLNFIGRGYKKVEHSEVMHSMHSSLAHLSDPFLHRSRTIPKITVESSDDEVIQIKTHHNTTDHHCCEGSAKSHHNRNRESNTSVLPYITD